MYEPVATFIQGKIESFIDGELLRVTQEMGLDVDRDELLKALQYDRGQYEKGYADGCRDSRKHGEWNILEYDCGRVGGYAPYLVVECTNCREVVRIEQGQYGWTYGDPFPWKRCPLCEAKMDGGEKDGSE